MNVKIKVWEYKNFLPFSKILDLSTLEGINWLRRLIDINVKFLLRSVKGIYKNDDGSYSIDEIFFEALS